jgi:Sulfotransferase family
MTKIVMLPDELKTNPPSSVAGLKVFIVGAPRSGTSIMLRAMKDVIGLPGYGESHAMPAFQRMLQNIRQDLGYFDDKDQNLMVKEINVDELEQHIGEFIRKLYDRIFPGGSWVDKSARGNAVAGLPLIESIFPNARLIMIRRNGIEVAVSHMKKFPGQDLAHACQSWSKAMRELRRADRNCRNLLIIDQYDLQNATEQVSQDIADHLGVPDKGKALAEFFITQRVQGSSTHDPKKRLQLADTGWPDKDKDLFKKICGPMMDRFGYEM